MSVNPAKGSCQVQDEADLVRRAQQKDQEAFARLYEGYFDKIYRYIVIKIGNQTEAEDMTQQVFLNALESISSFRWQGFPFSSWLYRIAHNQIVDHLRKKSKRVLVPLDESLPAVADDPEHAAEQKMEIEEVIAAAKDLTRAQQEVISLRFGG